MTTDFEGFIYLLFSILMSPFDLVKFLQKQKLRLALCSQVFSVSRTVPGTEQDSESFQGMDAVTSPPVLFSTMLGCSF